VREARLGIHADSDSGKVQAAASDSGMLLCAVAERIDILGGEGVPSVTAHGDVASLEAETAG